MDLLNLLVQTGFEDSTDLCAELAPILKIVVISAVVAVLIVIILREPYVPASVF